NRKVAKKFTSMLVDRTKRLRLGSGLEDKTDVGPVINEDALGKILEYIEIGRREDKAKLRCGGDRVEKGDLKYGYFIEPTVFSDVQPQMRIAQEEIFGPVVSVLECRDLDRERSQVRLVRFDLHQRHQSRVSRDGRRADWNLLCERIDDRRRGASS